MLKPDGPPGRPQPSIRSSMSRGSSCGTLSSAARTAVTARSSGRRSLSEPLTARPIGVRAVATITASGIGSSQLLARAHCSVVRRLDVALEKTLPDKLLVGKGGGGGCDGGCGGGWGGRGDWRSDGG